jgi:hypothetical protein
MPLILYPLFGLSVVGERLPGANEHEIEAALDASVALMAAFEVIPAPDMSVEPSIDNDLKPSPDLENTYAPPPPTPGRR